MEVGKSKVLFRKKFIDSDLLKYDSIKKLVEYVNSNDVKLDKVKALITRANKDLRMSGSYLCVKKSFEWDKDAENRICIIKKR